MISSFAVMLISFCSGNVCCSCHFVFLVNPLVVFFLRLLLLRSIHASCLCLCSCFCVSAQVKLTLLEAAPRVLAPFSEHLAQHATSHLEERGVHVRCRAGVTSLLGPHDATVKAMGGDSTGQEDEKLSFGALVWVAGIATRPLVQNLATRLAAADAASSSNPSSNKSCQPMPRRGLAVDEWLRVKGVEDGSVFALGDCALSGLPPTAQVARDEERERKCAWLCVRSEA